MLTYFKGIPINNAPPHLIQLVQGVVNREYKICEVAGKDAKIMRLCELGFVSGQIIKIIAFAPRKKTLMIELMGSILAINKELSEKIMVAEL